MNDSLVLNDSFQLAIQLGMHYCFKISFLKSFVVVGANIT